MKMSCAAIAVAASAATVLMPPRSVAIAKGPGPGMHAFHFKSHFLSHHHNRHGARRNNNALGWPLYGGLYAMPPYDGDTPGEQAPPAVVVVRDYQLPRLVCEKYRETITVPSESGGTRDITVTRC
ncbi:MAG TPA: hypothetical protein VFI98_07000 [Pseudolabrys sp.]|nr:hypothetical protein [Pseudolabrys sp.]